MSQIRCSFVKFGCSIGIFLNFPNLICRSMDISKCLRGSLRLRDNESRLYLAVTSSLPSWTAKPFQKSLLLKGCTLSLFQWRTEIIYEIDGDAFPECAFIQLQNSLPAFNYSSVQVNLMFSWCHTFSSHAFRS